jgi:hypothetical protein
MEKRFQNSLTSFLTNVNKVLSDRIDSGKAFHHLVLTFDKQTQATMAYSTEKDESVESFIRFYGVACIALDTFCKKNTNHSLIECMDLVRTQEISNE